MEINKAVIGALIFILLVVGANFFMYAIARGAVHTKGTGFWETINKSLYTPSKRENSMDELRKKMEELEKGKKE
jgi:hypothetical protein